MNPRPVYIGGENVMPIVGWACGKCGLQWMNTIFGGASDAAKPAANMCCDHRCRELLDDGTPCVGIVKHGWTVCSACKKRHERADEEARFEKAKKVSLADYDGDFVYVDGINTGYGDGYVPTEDVESILEDEGSPASWGWACAEDHATFDLQRHIDEVVLVEHHEDAGSNVDWDKIGEAQRLIDQALARVTSWHEDQSTVVLFPERKEEEAEEGEATP